ncbi:lipoyl(octanoyl) transferase LipB [bacterium]|nr:lipoyl(octanoyl) transferase LipB [bacterium]
MSNGKLTAEVTKCTVVEPGLVAYTTAIVLQESYAKKILDGSGPETLILLEHPHVITLGRGFHKENLLMSAELLAEHGVAVEETGRGGDVTYHGPGQVVGYPILNISNKPDLHLYLRNLEELMIRCVADFGIQADRKPGMTGIWVGDEKIGAIGVRVVRWITSHGFALNVNTDLKYFDYIVPCGIKQYGVTSLQKLLGHEVPIQKVHESLIKNFEVIFNRRVER